VYIVVFLGEVVVMILLAENGNGSVTIPEVVPSARPRVGAANADGSRGLPKRLRGHESDHEAASSEDVASAESVGLDGDSFFVHDYSLPSGTDSFCPNPP
jgi:hypothetical protein